MTFLPHKSEPTSIERFSIHIVESSIPKVIIDDVNMDSEIITDSGVTDSKQFMTPEQELEVSRRVQDDEHKRQLAMDRQNPYAADITPTTPNNISDVEQKKLTPEEERIEKMAREIRDLQRNARIVERQMEWKKNRRFKLEFVR